MKLVLCGYDGYGYDKLYLDKYLINKDLPFPMLYELSNLDLSSLTKINSYKAKHDGDCLFVNEILRIKIDKKNYVTFVIKDIDVSRNWCLVEYDNSLDIKYLDYFDESLNYWGVL